MSISSSDFWGLRLVREIGEREREDENGMEMKGMNKMLTG
jgi:hypothetical protein